jgi:hypothetical protein
MSTQSCSTDRGSCTELYDGRGRFKRGFNECCIAPVAYRNVHFEHKNSTQIQYPASTRTHLHAKTRDGAFSTMIGVKVYQRMQLAPAIPVVRGNCVTAWQHTAADCESCNCQSLTDGAV